MRMATEPLNIMDLSSKVLRNVIDNIIDSIKEHFEDYPHFYKNGWSGKRLSIGGSGGAVIQCNPIIKNNTLTLEITHQAQFAGLVDKHNIVCDLHDEHEFDNIITEAVDFIKKIIK